MATAKQNFLRYLKRDIIPDTIDSGRKYTAQDLKKCARLISAGKKDAKFSRYLTETLIPDFRESGSTGYVQDFEECVSYITPKRKGR